MIEALSPKKDLEDLKADLREVFAPEQPLGQWRKMVQELYALELRLPHQKAGQKSSALAP